MTLKYFMENDSVHFVVLYHYKTLKEQGSKEASLNFVKWWQFPHFYAKVKLGFRATKLLLTSVSGDYFFLEESKCVLSSCI
jgi:hypothetical protein